MAGTFASSVRVDRLRVTARAEDSQGTPTQSHISPSILVYEDELSPSADTFRRVCTIGIVDFGFAWNLDWVGGCRKTKNAIIFASI